METIKQEIWDLLDGVPNEYKIKYLVLDLKEESYIEGLNKGTQICKDVYQKDSNSNKKAKEANN